MAAAHTSTGTGITVAIARDPALVRTVRLIAAAVARRADQDEEFVEEVRLAVGEACALMVGGDGGSESRDGRDDGHVTVTLSLERDLVVDVTSPGHVTVDDASASAVDGVEPWSLLRGLVEDVAVDHSEDTTTLRMSWTLDRPS